MQNLEIAFEDANLHGFAMPPAEPQVPPAQTVIAPQQRLERDVASITDRARAIVVIDQATLDKAGKMLAEVIKPLRQEASDVFDPIISAANKSHKEALAGKARVEKPLIEAENILKRSIASFLEEVERKNEEARRIETANRQAQERLRLAQAEQTRLLEQQRINERNQAAHEEEIEKLLDTMPADASPEDVRIICESPAPAPVEIPAEKVVLPAVTVVPPSVVLPPGMSARAKFKGELVDMREFLQGILDGKTSIAWVEIDFAAVNKYANAVKPEGFNIPGLRCVRDFSTIQRKVK